MNATILLQVSSGGLMQIVPLLLVFVVMYFFMIRPQMKKAKEHKKYIEGLQKGVDVVTSAGIHGKIVEVGETTFSIEVANNIVIRFDKSAIALGNSK